MSQTVAIVMAAGKGTRMESDLPKVLIPVRGRPMIEYVLDALSAGGVDRMLVVVGYRADDVRAALAGREQVEFVTQAEQLGTGHAVMVCRSALGDFDGPVVVVAGDSPMLRGQSVRQLLDEFARRQPACLLGTAHKENPAGLGRIVRDPEGNFAGIVEECDADDQQRRITEVNMSTYVFRCRDLFDALSRINTGNAQGEYYLTDCPGILKAAGRDVQALAVLTAGEALSINNQQELAAVERAMQS